MPTWNTSFHPIFGRGEGAKAAMMALERFANIIKIPKHATWRAFSRKAGVFVTAEWADDLWLTDVCLVCGIVGPVTEHVHSFNEYVQREDDSDAKSGP